MQHITRLQHRAAHAHGARQRNAVAWLLAFERGATLADRAHRQTESLMRRMPHDGRPPAAFEVRSVAVNGQEVRGSTRWRTSKVARDNGRRIVGLPLWVTSALDTDTIERVWPLHVEPMGDTDGTERAPKPTNRKPRVSPSAARAERLRAAATSTVARARDAATGATT